ncbi:MAG: translation initiation factor IF-2 [Armatimonadota bacterium]
MANGGIRIPDLARELRVRVADIERALADMGVRVRGPNSVLDVRLATRVRERLRANGGPTQRSRPAQQRREVELFDGITVRELADKLSVGTAEVQKALLSRGILAPLNHQLSYAEAADLARGMGYTVKEQTEESETEAARAATRSKGTAPRPPVVTIMGHVDHGKTTLLDAIRKSRIAEQEYGGITQHIGAYQVEVDGRKITFLDTPGHEAFTAMRARGAQVTDIAVLVVAADDGIMPQTEEAIAHARAAGVPILVAINKIDKPDANPERTRQQLAEHGLVPEEWGGDTVCVDVSAKAKIGLDDLLTAILVLAEELDLRADPYTKATGVVIEAQLDRGRGPVATVLVQNGTLKAGEAVVVGTTCGRIRAMVDDRGQRVAKAGPSTPVEISGLSDVPQAGDKLEVCRDETEARQIAAARASRQGTAEGQRAAVSELIRSGEMKTLNIVLKGDVQGSVEAVQQALMKLSTEDVKINILHKGVGNISENDVLLASASQAMVVGFNVRIDPDAKRAAEADGVDCRAYRVIYDLANDVRAALSGMLEPVFEEVKLGSAEVRATFRTPRGIVAGCYIKDGRMVRGADVRVIRGKQELFTGRITSLRHVKEDVRELPAGYECGIMIDGFNGFEQGDILEAFSVQEKAQG